jgi:hypothetical protein
MKRYILLTAIVILFSYSKISSQYAKNSIFKKLKTNSSLTKRELKYLLPFNLLKSYSKFYSTEEFVDNGRTQLYLIIAIGNTVESKIVLIFRQNRILGYKLWNIKQNIGKKEFFTGDMYLNQTNNCNSITCSKYEQYRLDTLDTKFDSRFATLINRIDTLFCD